jgi:transcriptional regulator GlxA family with amidase domain
MRQLRIWVYDECLASAVSGPLDVFSTANTVWKQRHRGSADALFSFRLESVDGRAVRTSSGLSLAVDGKVSPRGADAILLPGIYCGNGPRRLVARLPEFGPLMSALRHAHGSGTLIAANCSASFLLAESGMLEGRAATTTWWLERTFRERYPNVRFLPQRLLTEEDGLVCSGATTAYLNLALHLVERFAGPDLAATCARLLLIDANRTSQAPYVTGTLQEQLSHDDALVLRAQEWIGKRLGEPIRLGALARAVSASERTVIRHFNRAIGQTPTEYAQRLRMQVAKGLLETSTLPVEEIGERVGYRDPSAFRRLFKREVGMLPRAYREGFSRRLDAKGAFP